MVKNGIRATKIPEFEDEADWLEPIGMTIALCAFPLLLILLIAGAFLGSRFDKITVFDVPIGTYITALLWGI